MSDTPSTRRSTAVETEHEGMQGCLVRLFWLVAGNAALLAIAALIYRDDTHLLSPISLAYWGIVAAIAAARFYDVRKLGGQTTDGRKASEADLRAYWPRLVAFAGALWGAAHAL
jgi:hypothetical protein